MAAKAAGTDGQVGFDCEIAAEKPERVSLKMKTCVFTAALLLILFDRWRMCSVVAVATKC